MLNKINIPILVTIIVLITFIFGGMIYFMSINPSNSYGQKQPTQAKQTLTSIKQIETTNETGLPSNSSLDKTSETSFDSCGKIDIYKNESWFSNFAKTLNSNNIVISNISEACLSLDKNILIALVKGNYCQAGLLFQYNIPQNTFSKAMFDDHQRGCVAWPTEFGKRNGKTISLQGSGGDAGCGTTMYYDYNYMDNKIELKKECSQCEKEKQATCSDY